MPQATTPTRTFLSEKDDSHNLEMECFNEGYMTATVSQPGIWKCLLHPPKLVFNL